MKSDKGFRKRKRVQEKNPDKISETQSIPEAGTTGTVGTTYDSDGNPASLTVSVTPGTTSGEASRWVSLAAS